MRTFRTYNQVDHSTGSELLEQVLDQRARLAERLSGIGQVVAVASGKGGVGKSLVTANLAAALHGRGRAVGVVDADLNGPSIGRMLGVPKGELEDRADGVRPLRSATGIPVMSMEFLQDSDDAPLRWKGPGTDTFIWQSAMEANVLREFLGDVDWGDLDVLLIDLPPGTDKISRLLELVPELPAALVVTTPSEMARAVVARSIRLLDEAGVPSLGIVANMSEYLCPGCGGRHPLFPGDGARRLSETTGVPIRARIPFDPGLARRTDEGALEVSPEPDGEMAEIFKGLADYLDSLPPRSADEEES